MHAILTAMNQAENLNLAVVQAHDRIQAYVRRTPLIRSLMLSRLCNANVYLKLENIQLTCSFKVRGAFNKLLLLDKPALARGVVAASTGNHGAAVAYASQILGTKARVFVPIHAAKNKLASIKSLGAIVDKYGDDGGETEAYAREYAHEHNLAYISPYNDLDVIAGQGTIGYEILMQKSDIDAIYVPVGGGGIISGIGGYVKIQNPKIQLMGCLPSNSPVMYESIKAKKIVDLTNTPTLSDATAGNMESGAMTFEFCQRYVDDYCLVNEDTIVAALHLLITQEHLLVEGAAALTLAAILDNKSAIKDKNIVLVLSGGNIDLENIEKVIKK